jgi:cobalt-zinc-cadmium efflux system membrane fusion protein
MNCSEEQHTETGHGEAAPEEHNEVVQLSAAELVEFNIELGIAAAEDIQIQVNLPGEIVIPSDQLAHIHPRFSGIVKDVYKYIGDEVKVGEALALIEGNASLSEYKVTSLLNGEIIEKHLTRGEVIDDAEHGFVVADMSQVWANLSLYQKDLPFVKIGQQVVISSGENLPQVQATITYISPVMNEVTRTAIARAIIPNRDRSWKPGLFITGSVKTRSQRVSVAVPKTALEFFEGEQVVFVQTAAGFEPRPVTIGLTNAVNVEITHGLAQGETYVKKGGFTLKAELQKSEMDAGHAH